MAIILQAVGTGGVPALCADAGDLEADWQPWDISGQESGVRKESLKYPSPFAILKSIPSGAIIIYQKLISPQQGGVCNFEPSCSQFSLLSIKKYGIIKGILMTSDRLQRCHYCVSGEYDYSPESGRFYDPVKNHCLSEDLRCLEHGYVEKDDIIVPYSL
ncbi:membrane protein insertion efficiency factor YidD [Candidatus Desantisbacteria bacterium]|nr:membrane protein insertion efficiency factor YidD [Candidatus Desantisbacteria bacterium]